LFSARNALLAAETIKHRLSSTSGGRVSVSVSGFSVNCPGRKQGDRIGQIFAYWASVFFGQFVENMQVDQIFGYFFRGKSFIYVGINFNKKV
jgi:hypothetical protein